MQRVVYGSAVSDMCAIGGDLFAPLLCFVFRVPLHCCYVYGFDVVLDACYVCPFRCCYLDKDIQLLYSVD